MATKEFIAFDSAGNIFELDGKLVRKRQTIVSAAMKAAIRAALGVPAAAEGLVPSQNLNDVANKQTSRDNLDLYDKSEVYDHVISKQAANAILLGNNGYLAPGVAFPGTNPLRDKFTILMRVRIKSVPASAAYIGMVTSGSAASSAAHANISIQSDGRIDMQHYDGAFKTANAVPASAEVGKVYSLALRVDSAANGLSSFSDGKKINDIAVGAGVVSGGRWNIGVSNADQSGIEVIESLVFNKALTDAQIALYSKRPGIVDRGDQWGSDAELITNGEFTSDVSGWTATNATMTQATGTTDPGTVSPSADDGVMKLVDNGGSSRATQAISCVVGTRYKTSGYYYNKSTNAGAGGQVAVSDAEASLSGAGAVAFTVDDAWTYFEIEFIATATTMYIGHWTDSTTGDTSYIDGVTTKAVGVVQALLPENIKANGDILDASSNGLHAIATVASPLKKSQVTDVNALSPASGAVLAQWANNDTVHVKFFEDGKINFANLPTSSAGLSSGDLWSNAGVLTVVA